MAWDKPRDPERFEAVLAEVRRYWELVPDLRLGQLVVNASRTVGLDTFNIEDDQLVEGLKSMRREIG